jgi:hypothetical protein
MTIVLCLLDISGVDQNFFSKFSRSLCQWQDSKPRSHGSVVKVFVLTAGETSSWRNVLAPIKATDDRAPHCPLPVRFFQTGSEFFPPFSRSLCQGRIPSLDLMIMSIVFYQCATGAQHSTSINFGFSHSNHFL